MSNNIEVGDYLIVGADVQTSVTNFRIISFALTSDELDIERRPYVIGNGMAVGLAPHTGYAATFLVRYDRSILITIRDEHGALRDAGMKVNVVKEFEFKLLRATKGMF